MIREPGMRVASKVSSHCSGDHHVPNLELTRTPPTVVLPTSQWWDGTTLKDIYTDEFLRVGRFSRVLALISNKPKYFSHQHTFKNFQNKLFKHSDVWVELKLFKEYFWNPQLKSKQQFWKHIEQVPKSPWITMDRKGANTFPFYNLLPGPKKKISKVFAVLFKPFLRIK